MDLRSVTVEVVRISLLRDWIVKDIVCRQKRNGNMRQGEERTTNNTGSNNVSEVAWYGYYDEDDKNRTITKGETKR